MKMIFLCLSLSASLWLTNAQAQNPLTNTAWQGPAQMDAVANVVMQFKQDTVYAYIMPDKERIETMTYKIQGDQIVFTKLSGTSPCDDQPTGTYQFTIKADELTITVVDDACRPRRGTFIKPLKKVGFTEK